MAIIKRYDWVTVGDYTQIGLVKSISRDGSMAVVRWPAGTKRMPTESLTPQHTIAQGGGWTVTDETRRKELEGIDAKYTAI